jgi:nucleotide-binding universal stress UspA family protein
VPDALERYGLEPHPDLRTAVDVERLLARDVSELVGAFLGFGSHVVRLRASAGRAAEALVDLARAGRADLVVVGAHHRRGPARVASISSAVLRLAPMAVAIAPTPAAGLAPELPDRVRRVLVATDLTPESSAAIPFALSLVDRGGVVHVLHVLPPHESSQERERQDAVVAEELRSAVPVGVSERGISVEVQVSHGEPVGAICDLAEQLGVDLVCVTSRHRGFARAMGSVVSEVLRESRKPVLVFRPPPP